MSTRRFCAACELSKVRCGLESSSVAALTYVPPWLWRDTCIGLLRIWFSVYDLFVSMLSEVEDALTWEGLTLGWETQRMAAS